MSDPKRPKQPAAGATPNDPFRPISPGNFTEPTSAEFEEPIDLSELDGLLDEPTDFPSADTGMVMVPGLIPDDVTNPNSSITEQEEASRYENPTTEGFPIGTSTREDLIDAAGWEMSALEELPLESVGSTIGEPEHVLEGPRGRRRAQSVDRSRIAPRGSREASGRSAQG